MKLRFLAMLMVLMALFLNLNASERITYKAAKSTSSYYQMAVQLGESITKATNQNLIITIEESQGSVQNVKEARKRGGNYLFTTPPGLLGLAQNGKSMFEKDDPKDYANIKSLFPIPFLTMHFVVAKESGIRSFEDLQGKSLLTGKGSYGANEAKKYVELFGLDKVKLIDAELSGAVTALKNGQIDAFATSGSYPAPNIIEAAASMDIVLLNMSDEQIKLTGRDKLIIPSNTYSGVSEE
ncbi:MAG: TAXI family TRAP transporter solute-binding subunit, partial [Campylobacteraceae bacterium]|nr:TAXI family TRAP transporter solute-binding subunit [Campylobacteraceae bacterium]